MFLSYVLPARSRGNQTLALHKIVLDCTKLADPDRQFQRGLHGAGEGLAAVF
jgi:hypothetical protein